MENLVAEISRLKQEKNAIILSHNYQRTEIFEVADFIGDSLGLCQEAKTTKADLIVFSGVHFMAESAAILNPDKKVVIPDPEAGCAMADMIDVEGLLAMKAKYPGVPVVMYVNSTAEIKAESDVLCTSANAVKVVQSLSEKRVICAPDKNLADFIQSKIPDKEIIPWDGYCPIHQRLNLDYVKQARKRHPKAKIIAHPECPLEVSEAADYCLSTSKMVEAVKNDPAKEFIVMTECGMIKRLQKVFPDRKFYTLCSMCFDMKKNTLEKIRDCLVNEKPVVSVDPAVSGKALQAFERMFNI
ncbi:quinolinate synthase NadA [Candidatus Peregrinibacteria bacterium]|jgi:quinolinate synthase|nr:quinolinate synthase NadA [Candidatus Peregrinibacteria bacterium]MBT7484380.1 quinolinate synthase NadA [Candidatus Peregrinibacteria bacterium]MBT7703797.1 quinolinate synthase NadA [Candidatus Peregrinibacteria bacterium]